MKALFVVVVPVLALSSCGISDRWGKTVVLYDGPAEAEAAQSDVTEPEPVGQSSSTGGAALAQGPEVEPVTDAELGVPTSAGSAASIVEAAADLGSLFALEGVVDELSRAIRDGLDGDGSLTAHRDRLQARLLKWRREVGDSYGRARRARLDELKNYRVR